ncbi:MAG: DUF4340 domain-containing protein [Lentisphaerae bacterium]|nr:DUF4340 domain-containing protein [Lentisphaerota bacterium]
MRPRTMVILVVLACATGAAVWFSGRAPASRENGRATEQPFSPGRHLCPPGDAEITSIGIDIGDLDLYLRRTSEGWRIVRPLDTAASATAVERILASIEETRIHERITEQDRLQRELTLADYGLDPPRARLRLGRGEDKPCEVRIGSVAPLGTAVYVMTRESGDIYAADGTLTNAIPSGIEAVRDRSLLRADSRRVRRFELRRKGAGFIRVQYGDDGWQLQQPVSAPASARRVEKTLAAVFGLPVQSFVFDRTGQAAVTDDAAVADAWVEPYGLATDEAVAGFSVWFEGDEVPREALFGKEAPNGCVYARLIGRDSIVTVPTNVLGVIMTDAMALREKLVLPYRPRDIVRMSIRRGAGRLTVERSPSLTWRITEPAQMEADGEKVEEALSNFTGWAFESVHDGQSTNLAPYGLSDPFCSVELSVRTAAPPPSVAAAPALRQVRVLVGDANRTNRTVYAMIEGSGSVFEIPLKHVTFLGVDPADPLAYRSRTIMAVNPGHVTGIAVKRGDAEEGIARNAEGGWRAVSPGGGNVDTNTVSDVLFMASNLRAIRVHSRNMDQLDAFGLNTPWASLMISLEGDEEIRKTLLFGNQSRNDGVYVRLQGVDVVFVLSNEAVRMLTGSLLTKHARK